MGESRLSVIVPGNALTGGEVSPDQERPRRWGQVSFFASVVYVARSSDGVNVRPEEQEVHNDIDELDVSYE